LAGLRTRFPRANRQRKAAGCRFYIAGGKKIRGIGSEFCPKTRVSCMKRGEFSTGMHPIFSRFCHLEKKPQIDLVEVRRRALNGNRKILSAECGARNLERGFRVWDFAF
jgi:hypothetical protein